jgi:hypothetical protein
MRIRIRYLFDPGFGIWDKHPGSATLIKIRGYPNKNKDNSKKNLYHWKPLTFRANAVKRGKIGHLITFRSKLKIVISIFF